MDAEKPDDKEIESDAVRPKCDEDAAKLKTRMVQRQASRKIMQMTKQQQQQQKIFLKKMMKSQVKMKQLEGMLRKGEVLQEERNNFRKR